MNIMNIMKMNNSNLENNIITLVNNGANINEITNGYTPLMYAINNKPLKIIKLLIEKGANLNKITNGYTPLMYAIDKIKPLKIIELLIEKDANINEINKNGYTPLMLYINNLNERNKHDKDHYKMIQEDHYKMIQDINHYKMIQKLVTPQNVNIANKLEKWTALHIFVNKGYDLHTNHRIIKLLIKNGADINSTNSNKRTPLSIFIFNYNNSPNNFQILKLLSSPDNVKIQDVIGVTPLMIAIETKIKEMFKIVKFLIKIGSDVNAETKEVDGKIWTPLNLALKIKNWKIINLLIQNGANLLNLNNTNYNTIIKHYINNPTEIPNKINNNATKTKLNQLKIMKGFKTMNTKQIQRCEKRYGKRSKKANIIKAGQTLRTKLTNIVKKRIENKEETKKYRNVLKKIKKSVIEMNNKKCPVCLENDSKHVFKACNHSIHKTCFNKCFSKGITTCPTCRGKNVSLVRYNDPQRRIKRVNKNNLKRAWNQVSL